MNYKFKLANVEVTVPGENVNIKVGELVYEVEDLKVTESIQVMKAIPQLMREVKAIMEEDNSVFKCRHPHCDKHESKHDDDDIDFEVADDIQERDDKMNAFLSDDVNSDTNSVIDNAQQVNDDVVRRAKDMKAKRNNESKQSHDDDDENLFN